MEKIWYKLPSIIFNSLEIIFLILCGIFLKLQYSEVLLIIIIFVLTRNTANSPLHYKSAGKCFIWTALVFCSLFLLLKVDIIVSIVLTIFSAYILTEKGNIDNSSLFMYRNENEEKYREMKAYIRENEKTLELKNFEKNLMKLSEIYEERYKMNFYKVYILKFKQNKTFEQIRKELKLYDNHKVTEILDIIFMSFNMYLLSNGKLEEKEEKDEKEELTSIG